jgi:hypothetical protein
MRTWPAEVMVTICELMALPPSPVAVSTKVVGAVIAIESTEPDAMVEPSITLPPGVATILMLVAFSVLQLKVTFSPEATEALEVVKLRILAALVTGGVVPLSQPA